MCKGTKTLVVNWVPAVWPEYCYLIMDIGRICLQHKSPIEAIYSHWSTCYNKKCCIHLQPKDRHWLKCQSQVPIGRWQLNSICCLEILSFRWGYLLAELSRQFLGVDWKRVGRCESPWLSGSAANLGGFCYFTCSFRQMRIIDLANSSTNWGDSLPMIHSSGVDSAMDAMTLKPRLSWFDGDNMDTYCTFTKWGFLSSNCQIGENNPLI